MNAQVKSDNAASDDSEVGGYFSQFRPAKKWSAGLQLGPTFYNGDADNFSPGFNFGAHVKYSVSQSFGLKAYGDIGTLRGGRENQKFSNNSKDEDFNSGNQDLEEDNDEFTNNFKDINLVAVYTLGNISFLRPLRKIQVFTFFGVGAIWSDVTGFFTGFFTGLDA